MFSFVVRINNKMAIKLKDRKDEINLLVEKVKEGDHDAFSDLYDIFIDQIYRYVYYRVNSSDVEDLVATLFVKIWENIQKFNPKKGAFSSWIFRITHNLVVDYYRKAKDNNFDELKIDIASKERTHSPLKATERVIDNEVLFQALKKLKKNYQEIIIHKFINELSNKEISEILGKSEGSLRILQHRALKALREVMNVIDADFNV